MLDEIETLISNTDFKNVHVKTSHMAKVAIMLGAVQTRLQEIVLIPGSVFSNFFPVALPAFTQNAEHWAEWQSWPNFDTSELS